MPARQATSEVDWDSLKSTLRSAISLARTWEELADVLKENGIKLSPKGGGGLVVRNTETDEEICKLSALKLRYVELIRHFDEGFPEHPATWLVERALNDEHAAKNSKKSEK